MSSVACATPTPQARNEVNFADRVMYDAKAVGRNAVRAAVYRHEQLAWKRRSPAWPDARRGRGRTTMREGITLETFQSRGAGRLPGLVGFRVVAVEHGMLVAELDLRDDLLAPNGYLHAASVIALADTACGYGCLAHLPDGADNFTTIELKSNFLGTAQTGTLSCIARPVHLGRTTQVWDATVARQADGGTIALFRCTQMVLWPKN